MNTIRVSAEMYSIAHVGGLPNGVPNILARGEVAHGQRAPPDVAREASVQSGSGRGAW